MKTRFDDRAELLCTEGCYYEKSEFKAGESVVLSDHPAVRRMPENFEPLTAENAPTGLSCSLREELEFRAQRIEEMSLSAVQEKKKHSSSERRQTEAAFWRDAAEILSQSRAPDLDRLPDPAAEAEEEAALEEGRRQRLPHPDSLRFWDEAEALVERHDAAQVFSHELREQTD